MAQWLDLSFAELASYLNSRGIAVLRIDDRGVGKTTGIYQQATTEDFAQDIEAGIDFLKNSLR
jgi:alpha/beta superfamily hydrolase